MGIHESLREYTIKTSHKDKVGNASLMNSQSLPGKVHDFRAVRGVVKFIRGNFDIKPDENKTDKQQAD